MDEKTPNRVFQTNQKTGVVYVYEDHPYWDPDKQQSRSKRKCVGKLDSETGDTVATRGRKPKERQNEGGIDVARKGFAHKYCGATHLLDCIGKATGVFEDLKKCFPETYKQILSVAYYLVMEDQNPMYRFEKWGILHRHPYGKDISSQDSSDLFASITSNEQHDFFRLQARRRVEKECWAYDTTTISSYSETLRQVQYGKNKEHDDLPQLKLLLLFGERSGLPFYYRKLAGNTPDSKTVWNLLADLDWLGCKKVKLVMDRGFYKEGNINDFYRSHVKFLIGGKISLDIVRNALESAYEKIRSFENYSSNHDVYAYTAPTEWNYTQERPYKKDILKEKRRIYVHLYYNIEKAADDERKTDRLLSALQEELLSGKLVDAHAKQYEKYFSVKRTPKRGVHITPKNDAIQKAKRYYGYFSLLTNERIDALTALVLYRLKDVVEKAFGNLKERLNGRRQYVSSELSLDGKMFVEFVALIYLSYIHKRMNDEKIYAKYTLNEMLDKLDIIECFETPGKRTRYSEITEKQRDLFSAFGFSPPR